MGCCMTDENSNEQGMEFLKQKISRIEWDLPNLKNGEIKAKKIKELENYKSRLDVLRQSTIAIQKGE